MNTLNPNGRYAMYLRRSRADEEMEARGSGETLSRHYAMLTELAKSSGIVIPESAIYREIKSGDTIEARPVVQQLLADVWARKYDGVFVTEMSRLARGNTSDQGAISDAFHFSGTLIVTPGKVYDLSDQSDEAFAEMSLVMARMEYRSITRRMQAGRTNSAKAGLYCGSRDLYGYRRAKLPGEKGWSLEIVPEQAEVVRNIYDWFINGIDGKPAGGKAIANHLNDLGIPTLQGQKWFEAGVYHVIHNPTYSGKIQWDRRKQYIAIVDSKRTKKRAQNNAPVVVDGRHEPIVDEITWRRAQVMSKSRTRTSPSEKRGITNPLSGICKCALCGRAMILNNTARAPERVIMRCSSHNLCKSTSAPLHIVEQTVIDTLAQWCRDFDATRAAESLREEARPAQMNAVIDAAEKEIATLTGQLSRLRDLLEQGIYSPDVYVERQTELSRRISDNRAKIERLRAEITVPHADAIAANIDKIRTVIQVYSAAQNAEEKNNLLKSVICRVEYYKTTPNRTTGATVGDLSLEIYPAIPLSVLQSS